MTEQTKVSALPANNNLSNIPHMLRNLAQEFESGITAMPRTLFLVAIEDGSSVPALFQFGQEASRLEEVGAFAAVMSLALQIDDV